MRNFLIVYELHDQVLQKKANIAQTIAEWQCLLVHPLESVWIVRTELDPEEMFDSLKTQALEDHDYLLITEISDNYFGYLRGESWNVINHHIF